jgi:hypothetical protein
VTSNSVPEESRNGYPAPEGSLVAARGSLKLYRFKAIRLGVWDLESVNHFIGSSANGLKSIPLSHLAGRDVNRFELDGKEIRLRTGDKGSVQILFLFGRGF